MEQVALKRGRARPAWAGHPWIFGGAIAHGPKTALPGTLVAIVDERGTVIGHGHLGGEGPIAVRIVSLGTDIPDEETLIRHRVEDALTRRALLGLPSEETTAFRIVASEGDRLPGLIVDKLGDGIVIQFGTAGMLRLESVVKNTLHELLSPSWMIVQVSEDAARMEGIMPRSLLVHGDEEEVGSTQVLEWGIRHHVDPLGGQKTGFYADQRENRRRVAELAAGRKVLDCHCYGGAFGLNALLRGGAESVTCIDSSPRVVRLAKRNAAANNAEIRVEQADAAAWLRGSALSDRPDMILLDPPKFVRSRAHLNEALKKYRKLNELAMTALPPGGILVTSSCSGMVTPEIFIRMLTEAGMRAERHVHVMEVRGQAPDHPYLAAAPEGSYLTCVLATVSPR